LNQEAELIPVEGRASNIGDTVIADLEGTFDDDPNGEPIKAENLEVVLGDEVIEKAFTENLVGVTKTRRKNSRLPIRLKSRHRRWLERRSITKRRSRLLDEAKPPELNDEWAKSLDEGYESLGRSS
jgi:FKBP-type peptidyl-prolyl cis-trans isomerase (trigger factor)